MATEGSWVRVTKRLRFQDQVHLVSAEGRLIQRRRVRTQSSFAGSPEGRLWIDEIVIEKADGERSAMIVDPYTQIEELPDPKPAETGDGSTG